jgi:hypothetical protein
MRPLALGRDGSAVLISNEGRQVPTNQKRERPGMKYVRMGSTGTQVSRLCLGCMSFGGMADWTLNEDASMPILRKAVEAGINFFDTADIYSRGQSEEILGRGLKELKVRRDESVVAQAHQPVDRCQPDPAGHGLCRPLSDPPLRL